VLATIVSRSRFFTRDDSIARGESNENNSSRFSIPGAILVFIAGSGYAADKKGDIRKIDIGKAEYEQKCIICHGILGKGDGAVWPDVEKTRE
jgi:mono/diheme cytochrome c family protein